MLCRERAVLVLGPPTVCPACAEPAIEPLLRRTGHRCQLLHPSNPRRSHAQDAKPKAAPKAKAAAKEGEPKPAKKAPKLKPFTDEEKEIAKGASLERNAAIAGMLEGIATSYREGGEYIKAAAGECVALGRGWLASA